MYPHHREGRTLLKKHKHEERYGQWITETRNLNRQNEIRILKRDIRNHTRLIERYTHDLNKMTDPAFKQSKMKQINKQKRNNRSDIRRLEHLESLNNKPRAKQTSFKKPKPLIATKIIRNVILNYKQNGSKNITVEQIVNDTGIHRNIIKTAFMKLNREGLLSQAINHEHTDFEWIATSYDIL